jgi:uncharacterized membrane protein YgdD (TMEM256/DUF423 family)
MSSLSGGLSSKQDMTTAGERRDPRLDPSQTQGTVLEAVSPPAYGRGLIVSVIAAAIVFALAIFASGGDESFTGVPMTQTTGALFWGLSILAVVAIGFGAQYAEGVATRVALSIGQEARPKPFPSAWAVPAASVGVALLYVATYHNRMMLIIGPLIAFVGVAGGLFARDLMEDVHEETERTAALVHIIVVHAIAFLGLSVVYMNRMSGWIGGPIVFALTAVLIFEYLDQADMTIPIRVLYSLLSGGVMTLALLAVSWWPTFGWTGGAALLIVFYVMASMCNARASNRALRERDLFEYAGVFLIGMIILAFTV